MFKPLLAIAATTGLAVATPTHARLVDITITVQNLAAANSVSFAPLRFGFNNGSFDAFDIGGVATAPIISIAEGGSGADWLPAFAAADPTAVIASTLGGPQLPGSMQSLSFRVDTAVNPFFTFAAMVVPSNDFFIGNDDPMEYRLFDAAGNLLLDTIEQFGSDIWNAGSEAFDPANAAFLVGGVNDLRTPEGGVVEFNFSELAQFDGLTTAAGYVFNSGLAADSDIYRISFATAAVPEPATWAMLIAGFGAVGASMRRRHRAELAA